MGYIYILTSPNGKSYIGQTIRPIEKRRLEQHQESNRCRRIYNAIKKYGWNNFEKDWYECPDEDLNFDEELLVREMGTLSPGGYNLREGDGSHGKMSKETRQKIGEANRGENNPNNGKPISKETKQKIGDGNRGRIRSEEAKQKMNKPKSETHKLKIGEANSGEKNPMYGKTGEKNPMYGTIGEKSPTSKRVYQYDLDGTFIASFGSCREAGRYLKKDKSSIGKCACGTLKTAYKYRWSYNLDIFM